MLPIRKISGNSAKEMNPEQLVCSLVSDLKWDRFWSAAHGESYSYFGVQLKKEIYVLESKRKKVDALLRAGKQNFGFWGEFAKSEGSVLFLWAPDYRVPQYIIPIMGGSFQFVDQIQESVFFSDPIPDEGKGEGPSSSLAKFFLRKIGNVWAIEDIEVTSISDRLQVYSVRERIKQSISRLDGVISELEREQSRK